MCYSLKFIWGCKRKLGSLWRFISFSFEFMFYLMIILVVYKNPKIRTLYIHWLCKFIINISRASLLSGRIWKVFRQVPSDKFHYLNNCCGLTIRSTTDFPRGGFWQENPFTVIFCIEIFQVIQDHQTGQYEIKNRLDRFQKSLFYALIFWFKTSMEKWQEMMWNIAWIQKNFWTCFLDFVGMVVAVN